MADRCEMCELLACAHATAVQQLLQAAMWVDRVVRFKPEEGDAAIAAVEKAGKDAFQAWSNYVSHRTEEHP